MRPDMTQPPQGTFGSGFEGKARTTWAGTFLCWKLKEIRGKGTWLVLCCLLSGLPIPQNLNAVIWRVSSDWGKDTANPQFL